MMDIKCHLLYLHLGPPRPFTHNLLCLRQLNGASEQHYCYSMETENVLQPDSEIINAFLYVHVCLIEGRK